MPTTDPTISRDVTVEAGDTRTLSWSYDTVVNAVDDLGWDPTGATPITFSGLADGTLLVVPEGTYAYDGASWVTGSASRIGIRGLGTSRADVVFRSVDGTVGTRLMNVGGGDFHELQNFTLDWGPRRDTSGVCFRLTPTNNLIIEDIEWTGYCPPNQQDDEMTPLPTNGAFVAEAMLFANIGNVGGTGLIRNVDATGPSHIDGHQGGEGFGIHNDNHNGTVVYEDCTWHNVNGDAPVYSSGHGKVVFDSVEIYNAAMAGFRLGGISVVRNSIVKYDIANQHPDNTGTWYAANPIFVSSQAGENQTGTRIENVDVIVDSMAGTPGRPIQHHLTTGNVTVADSRIEVNAVEVNEITNETAYGTYTEPADDTWHFTNCSFTGTETVDHVYGMVDRPGSTADGCCVSIPYTNLSADSASMTITNQSTSGCALANDTVGSDNPEPSPPPWTVKDSDGTSTAASRVVVCDPDGVRTTIQN